MYQRLALGIAVLAAMNGNLAAHAQAANASPTHCELHIWPAKAAVVTFNGNNGTNGLIGDLVDGLSGIKFPEAVEGQMTRQLGPSMQADLMLRANIASLLGLPDYAVVMEAPESQPAWTPDRLKSNDRILAGRSTCYAELAIISQQYFKEPTGARLRTFFFYREYGAGAKPMKRVLDTSATGLHRFPAKQDDGIAASTEEIRGAFTENLAKFAHDKLKR